MLIGISLAAGTIVQMRWKRVAIAAASRRFWSGGATMTPIDHPALLTTMPGRMIAVILEMALPSKDSTSCMRIDAY